MKISIYISFILLLLTTPLAMFGQGWDLPEDADAQKAPFAFTGEDASKGETLYNQNCKSCHGDPGKGNYTNLQPAPGDPATKKIQKNSDGVLYYKLKNGKGQMPSFDNILSAKEIWQVIAYLRTFNDDYIQEVAEKTAREAAKGTQAEIILSLQNDSIVKALVKAIQASEASSEKKPLPNAAVELLAKRYFGNLPVGNAKNTDEDGVATFKFPTDLPGDSAGHVQLIARLQDDETFGTVKTDTTLQAGVPTDKPSLTAERAMWNDVTKTPLWLLFSYLIVVLTIWGFIFYTIYQLYLVRKLGNQYEKPA